MEIVLIATTVASLVVALAMAVVVRRLSNEERRRAAARVAALAAAASAGDQGLATPAAAQVPATTAPWRRAETASAGPLGASGSREPAPDVALHNGFLGTDRPARESAGRQHGLAAAAAVLAVVLGAFAYARVRGGDDVTQAAAAAPAPLELLSLRHQREGANLSVAGLVRNPPAASSVERVAAVVFLFDQQGAFVTSARAPIDFVKLTAGDESPFVVKVQAPASVARYRVSFRTDDGTLPHVDRRGEAPAATPVVLSK